MLMLIITQSVHMRIIHWVQQITNNYLTLAMHIPVTCRKSALLQYDTVLEYNLLKV